MAGPITNAQPQTILFKPGALSGSNNFSAAFLGNVNNPDKISLLTKELQAIVYALTANNAPHATVLSGLVETEEKTQAHFQSIPAILRLLDIEHVIEAVGTLASSSIRNNSLKFAPANTVTQKARLVLNNARIDSTIKDKANLVLNKLGIEIPKPRPQPIKKPITQTAQTQTGLRQALSDNRELIITIKDEKVDVYVSAYTTNPSNNAHHLTGNLELTYKDGSTSQEEIKLYKDTNIQGQVYHHGPLLIAKEIVSAKIEFNKP